jgi:hypothetical protein
MVIFGKEFHDFKAFDMEEANGYWHRAMRTRHARQEVAMFLGIRRDRAQMRVMQSRSDNLLVCSDGLPHLMFRQNKLLHEWPSHALMYTLKRLIEAD